MADSNLLAALMGASAGKGTGLVDSLFGPTPYDVGQARNQQDMSYAEKVARMGGFEQAKFGIGQGAAGLTRAGAGMMGMVDPLQQEAQMRESVMGMGGDLTTSAGLKAKAQQFKDAGDTRTALKLIIAANEMEAREQKGRLDAAREKQLDTKASLDIALAQKALKENPNLATATVGVKGRPGWKQLIIYDKTKPNDPYQEVGEPLESDKGVTVNAGGKGDSIQPIPYIDPITGRATWGTITEARGKPAAAFDPLTKQLVAQGVEVGKNRGEEITNLPKLEGALNSVKGASSLLDKGIYSGFWGPTQRSVMSATPGASKEKVANTDKFIAYIGETVVPRLKEFGGNDSNEELKYLQKISGGDLTMQESALRDILKNAELKISRGVDRVKKGLDANGNPVRPTNKPLTDKEDPLGLRK